MLKSVVPFSGSHDDLFIVRYQRLVSWALRLTDGQLHAAEDLVHDAFIQFTLKQPELARIESLDDYLFVMLRNLHISKVRRASQTSTITQAISDYDTARMGLRLIDAQRQFQARDDLRRVCAYVAQRKETSKSASVLILRFFHSYFPTEIAAILRTTRQAVEIWLLNARRESRLHLEDPGALKLITARKGNAGKVVPLPQRSTSSGSSDITHELCQMIFASRQGDCCTMDQLRELYESGDPIECKRMAHTVSCLYCLDLVNELLGLSPLVERYQMEQTGSGSPPSDVGSPPTASGGSGGSLGDLEKRLSRRRRETIEHRPQELRIAVNGFFVSRQKVGLPVNELALKLNLEEKISFIEVFSEQGTLLSHFTVTPPTDGEIQQREEVEFSEGRALETVVSFDTQWPTLKVVYRDPLVAHLQVVSVAPDGEEAMDALDFQGGEVRDRDEGPDGLMIEPQRPFAEPDKGLTLLSLRNHARRIFSPRFWLRPGTITGVFALLLVATALVIMRRPQSLPPAATDLLQRATAAEEVAAANTSITTHRTLQIEERRNSLEGEVLARQRVEVWRSAAKGITTRRLYDDRGRLLAGEWTRSDNVTTLYHHGARPRLEPVGPPEAPFNLDNVWQLSPSAKDFVALVGDARNIRLEERANHFVFSFDSTGSAAPYKVIQVRLVLSRDDLHPVEQTLLVQHADGLRAYRIVEASFERRPNDAVAPAVFEPEPELLGSMEAEKKTETSLVAPVAQPVAPVMATPALEVEVLQLLNQANAFMGEQLSVTRTAEGKLVVSGLVETEDRKSELLRALATVRNNPAVRIEVETVSAVAQREPQQNPSNLTVERVEATEGTSPVYADLKSKFSDDEARRYSDRVMARSRQARRHALALKQLAERFSLADLQALSPADRNRWIGLLREHASNFQREVQTLRRDLREVFPSLAGASAGGPAIDGNAEIQDAVRRLYELSVACDEDVRQSFAVSAQGHSTAQVTTSRFAQLLRDSETLAARIEALH